MQSLPVKFIFSIQFFRGGEKSLGALKLRFVIILNSMQATTYLLKAITTQAKGVFIAQLLMLLRTG
jgi:hypothetical protein